MAYTQTDLDNIKAAIATGQQTVEIGDRRVTYRSVDELLKALSAIEAALADDAGTAMKPRYQVARFSD